MSDRAVARLIVEESRYVSRHLLRIVLSGENIDSLRGSVFDDRLMIAFPDPDTGAFAPPELKEGRVHWPYGQGVKREYTISETSEDRLSIDFFIHEGGVAAAWAVNATAGDELWVSGPKSDTEVPSSTTFHVLLGDETALPAIERRLRELSPDARGVVAIEIGDVADRRELIHPETLNVTWLQRAAHPSHQLADFLTTVELPDSGVYLWAAGEKAAMKPIRIWARAHGFDRSNCNISGYWRY